MNEKAKKYVDLFRKVKIASAATVDQDGHPRSRIINVMIAAEEWMYIVTSKGKPFYEQIMNTGEIALRACPQKCIAQGEPWRIDPVHCLQCGACREVCPAGAVRKLHA